MAEVRIHARQYFENEKRTGSGHTTGACLTLPFGVRARVVTGPEAALIVEEAAVSPV